MKKVVDIHEEIIAEKLRQKTSGMFSAIDDILNAQADELIRLAVNGTLHDFVVMRPINPSVVHIIILRLIKS